MPVGVTTTRDASPSTYPLEVQRFFDLSPASRWVMLGKINEAPLLTMLSAGLGLPRRIVTETEFETLLDYEDITEYYIKAVDADAADAAWAVGTTTFALKDIAGNVVNANILVQENDLLHIPAYQTNQTMAEGTVGMSGEIIRVLNINVAGTIITVERDVGGAVATGAHVTADSGKWLEAFNQGPLHGETSRSRSILNHPGFTQTQYIQKFQETYGASEDSMKIVLAGGDPFEHEQFKKLFKVRKEIEYAMMNNKIARVISSTEGPKYMMKGFIPFILGDSTSNTVYTAANDLVTGNGTQRVWRVGDKDNFTIPNWHKLLERLYTEGSDRKVLLAGPGFYTMFLNTLDTYLTLDFESTTAETLGMKLRTWNHPYSDEPLIVMHHNLMRGAGGQDGMIVDIGRTRIAAFPGGDLHIWKGKDGTGLQENDVHEIKHAWEAALALDTTNQLAHAWITGIQNDDGTYGSSPRTVGTLNTVNV